MKKVSVIIPFYNSVESLRGCLRALREQTYPPGDFEVIAIDNASTEDVAGIKAEHPGVRWIFESRPGAYHARNHGIRHATGEIIALTDADCIPSPVWLAEAVAALENAPATIIAGRIDYLEPAGRELNVCEVFEEKFFLLTRHRYLAEQLGVVATANVVTYRAVFDRSGFFDSRLMSFGDGEWALRATAQGEVLRYADLALVRHPRRGTFREVQKKSRRLAGDKVVLLRQNKAGPARLVWDLYRYSILNPGVHLYALFFPKLTGVSRRVKMFALMEVLSLVNTAEKIRVWCGGGAFRG